MEEDESSNAVESLSAVEAADLRVSNRTPAHHYFALPAALVSFRVVLRITKNDPQNHTKSHEQARFCDFVDQFLCRADLAKLGS